MSQTNSKTFYVQDMPKVGGTVLLEDGKGGGAILYSSFFSASESEAVREFLLSRQGKELVAKLGAFHKLTPRLSAVYGTKGSQYRYSKVREPVFPWPPAISAIRDRIETTFGIRFSFVLALLYRGGKDSVAWHADDEKELNLNFPILSASFGASRRFKLRKKSDKKTSVVTVDLHDGDLVVMVGPDFQDLTQHCVPKTAKPVGKRVNLTFRMHTSHQPLTPSAPVAVTPKKI